MIHTRLHHGPLPPPPPPAYTPGGGATVTFDGVVRPDEAGRTLAALHYQAYEPMTTHELERLAADTVQRFGLLHLDVTHSTGDVPVNTCSFRLTLTAPHRREALDAMDHFIATMKRDVPLWKLPVYRN